MASIAVDHTDGEAGRDKALDRLRAFRPVLVRQIQRAFICHLLANGPGTSGAVRAAVPIPARIDPRVTGAAVRALSADCGLIVATGRRKSTRPEAHARSLDVWALKDRSAAEAWLHSHPELSDQALDHTPDPSDPFAV